MVEIVATGREYLRVSKDKSGRRRSVDEQHNDNQAAADDRSWTLGEPYADNDKSASRYARAIREDFGKLVSDLDSGQFVADYLILWEGSRGSREIEEWVRLVKLCERAGVKFFITSEDRILDPRNDHDWSALISMGQASEVESRKTSKRARRTTAANAAAGRPHGICPDGYVRQYDPKTGDLVAQVIDPDRAVIPEKLFELLLELVPLKEVARRFAANGWLNKSGRPFTPQHLRSMAKTHAYAGIRVHKRDRPSGGTLRTKPDLIVDATWPGIVSKEAFWKVQAILDAPERKTTRGGRATHLVSMIGRCGKCPAPIVATPARKPGSTPKYSCRLGHVSVDRAELDELATAVVVGFLSREDNYAGLQPQERTDELAKIRDRIAEVEHELMDLERALKRREISIRLAGPAEQEWLTELERLRVTEQGLRAPAVLQDLQPGDDIRAWWDSPDTTIAAKREVIRTLFVPEILGTLMLMPSEYLRQPAIDRVEFVKNKGMRI